MSAKEEQGSVAARPARSAGPRGTAQPSVVGLARVKLLAGVSQPELARIAESATWRRFAAGQTLIARNATGRDVFLVVGGELRVNIYSASGRQVAFRDLGAGDTVGEIAAIDGGPRSVDVTALSDVVVAILSPADFSALLATHPDVAQRFMRHLVQLIRLLTERVIELSTLGVQNRVHAELLRLARQSPGFSHQALIAPPPKHADIAARVNTTREQVTRELSALTRRGLLARQPGGLLITDTALLESMVVQAVSQPHGVFAGTTASGG